MNILQGIASIVLAVAACVSNVSAAPDPDFHIYLCIGQSNMEGNALIEPADRQEVPGRFLVMSTTDFSNQLRCKGKWYVAEPPLVREYTGLSPIDYFGRTMVANLPEHVRIGVIPVAVGGCKIEHLDKDFDPVELESEAEWFRNFMRAYDNYPYRRLIECAKIAQKEGVIKGILLHQGESNNGDMEWCKKVKKLYDNILSDLGLTPESVPLLAGEVVAPEQGGICGAMNTIIQTLPQTLSTAHVVSSADLAQKGDGLHFTSHAYRVLGCRYAVEMLATMGISDPFLAYNGEAGAVLSPEPGEGDYVFDLKDFSPALRATGSFELATREFLAGENGLGGWEYDVPVDLSGYKYLVAELEEEDNDNTELWVSDSKVIHEKSYEGKFAGKKLIVAELNGMMKNIDSGIVALDTSKVYRVCFCCRGVHPIRIKHVFATNSDPFGSSAGQS